MVFLAAFFAVLGFVAVLVAAFFVAVFLVANLDASLPSDAEVERVYEGGRHPFVDRPLEDVREPLRAFLMQAKLEIAVARWVGTLRDRVTVRVHADFQPETA